MKLFVAKKNEGLGIFFRNLHFSEIVYYFTITFVVLPSTFTMYSPAGT